MSNNRNLSNTQNRSVSSPRSPQRGQVDSIDVSKMLDGLRTRIRRFSRLKMLDLDDESIFDWADQLIKFGGEVVLGVFEEALAEDLYRGQVLPWVIKRCRHYRAEAHRRKKSRDQRLTFQQERLVYEKELAAIEGEVEEKPEKKKEQTWTEEDVLKNKIFWCQKLGGDPFEELDPLEIKEAESRGLISR